MSSTANIKRNKNALPSDLYTTPAWAVKALLKREQFDGQVLDAGCGKGHISKVLELNGYDVASIDLYDWGYGKGGVDFLDYQTKHENVIMNPPFTILSDFINRGIFIAKKRLAVFARVNVLETQGRYNEVFKNNPPSIIYQFVNRVNCKKGGHGNDDESGSAVPYVWMIWDFEREGETVFRWIDDPIPKKREKAKPQAPALHFSDIKTLIDETMAAFRTTFNDDEERQHIVSVSGGKDSTVTARIAVEATDGHCRLITCDTGNEHQKTYDYIDNLHINIGNGCLPVEKYTAQYTAQNFKNRQRRIVEKWSEPHVIRQGKYTGEIIPPMSQEQIQEAVNLTKPSGNVFLDMCILHGSMPTRTARFCTKELKIDVAFNQVYAPALAEFDGEIVNWSGVRAGESKERAAYKWLSQDKRGEGFLFAFLPIHKWTKQDVFAAHKYYGITLNPLYLEGSERVGCFPCIFSNQKEILKVGEDRPTVKRVSEWEKIITKLNRYSLWRAEKENIPTSEFITGFLVPRGGMVGADFERVVSWVKNTPKGRAINEDYDGAMMTCQRGQYNFCE